MGLTDERDALVVVDRFSKYIDVFPLRSKSAKDALSAFLEYFGPNRPAEVYVWSDSAHELTHAVKKLNYAHGRATPGRQ